MLFTVSDLISVLFWLGKKNFSDFIFYQAFKKFRYFRNLSGVYLISKPWHNNIAMIPPQILFILVEGQIVKKYIVKMQNISDSVKNYEIKQERKTRLLQSKGFHL